jgi:hypothetical protein
LLLLRRTRVASAEVAASTAAEVAFMEAALAAAVSAEVPLVEAASVGHAAGRLPAAASQDAASLAATAGVAAMDAGWVTER